MKNLYFIIFTLLAVLSSCEDDLYQAPISEQSTEDFYRNTSDMEIAVNGVYNTLKDYAMLHFYLSEVRSDNVYSPGTGVRDWNPVNNFEQTLATNDLMADAWSINYKGVSRANLVLENITEDNVPDETTRYRMIGECEFLRALFYFDLVRWFGKVPVYSKVISVTEALEIPRASVTEVYELVVSDLKDAIDKLPVSYDTPGKSTSGAARALLAKVYLTMSGNDYGIDGPCLGEDKYEEALAQLDTVITNGVYGWVDDYASIFDYNNENNADIVFDVQAIDDGQTGDRGVGAIAPTLMYLESYAKINISFAGGVSADSPIAPSDNFLNSFDTNDVRDDFSILMSFIDENDNTISEPQYVKFLDLNNQPADRYNWEINFPVIRYTDVLLMKAEALIQLDKEQSTVDDIVNKVRTRAGIDEVSNVTLDMLLEERRKEFMAEGLRWHDLVRTGKVLDIMNAWEQEDDASNVISSIDANDIIYAVPQDQIEVKEGLYDQNPDY